MRRTGIFNSNKKGMKMHNSFNMTCMLISAVFAMYSSLFADVNAIYKEGELRLGRSDVTVSGHRFSLQGGTLGLASGTENAVQSIDVAADSVISFGAGAALSAAKLTIGEKVSLLSVTGENGECTLRIEAPLEEGDVSSIRLNGKPVVQSGDGRLVLLGLVISVRR